MSLNPVLEADGPSEEFKAVNDLRIHGAGTFGGGTVALQEKQVTGSWANIQGAVYTAEFDDVFAVGVEPATLRFNLSGSTSPVLRLSARGEVTNG